MRWNVVGGLLGEGESLLYREGGGHVHQQILHRQRTSYLCYRVAILVLRLERNVCVGFNKMSLAFQLLFTAYIHPRLESGQYKLSRYHVNF